MTAFDLVMVLGGKLLSLIAFPLAVGLCLAAAVMSLKFAGGSWKTIPPSGAFTVRSSGSRKTALPAWLRSRR